MAGRPKRPRSTLTFKQEAFVRNYISNGFNGTKAMLDTGRPIASRSSASALASQTLSKPYIREAIMKALPKYNMDPDFLMQWLHQHIVNADVPYSLQAIRIALNLMDAYPDKVNQQVLSQIKVTADLGQVPGLAGQVRRRLLETEAIPAEVEVPVLESVESGKVEHVGQNDGDPETEVVESPREKK